MPFPDEEIDTQRRKIFCRKVTKLESAESRASASRVLPLLVFSSRPVDASENAPTSAALVPGLGWGRGEPLPLFGLPAPLGLQPLTSVLIIWRKSAPQLHECHSHEHL